MYDIESNKESGVERRHTVRSMLSHAMSLLCHGTEIRCKWFFQITVPTGIEVPADVTESVGVAAVDVVIVSETGN